MLTDFIDAIRGFLFICYVFTYNVTCQYFDAECLCDYLLRDVVKSQSKHENTLLDLVLQTWANYGPLAVY